MINSGDWVKTWGGPEWTPYARAIASQYAIQIPWFLTVYSTLTGAALERRTVVTDPWQYDTLIFGAHINIGTDGLGDNGQQVYLNMTDLEANIPWSVPNTIGASPMTAYGGSRVAAMPILKLPEAVFIPAHTRLRHDFKMINAQTVSGGTITWVGVQLINPCGLGAPECVVMPDGSKIRTGTRRPWMCTIGLGRETALAGALTYAMTASGNYLHYTPPVECDVEIHDIACNFFVQGGVTIPVDDVVIKIADAGERGMWTPSQAPVPSVFGNVAQVFPALPFSKPYLLRKNHRLQIFVLNRNTGTTINNAMATIRGVQLCEY